LFAAKAFESVFLIGWLRALILDIIGCIWTSQAKWTPMIPDPSVPRGKPTVGYMRRAFNGMPVNTENGVLIDRHLRRHVDPLFLPTTRQSESQHKHERSHQD